MVDANPTLYKWVNWQGIWGFLPWIINHALFRSRWRRNNNTALMRVDKSPLLATIGPMSQSNLKLIPIKKINRPGFRGPDFSPEFRKQWHTEIRMLLRGHFGGKVAGRLQTTCPGANGPDAGKTIESWQKTI